ncbi:MAG TPA: hypothetical protein VFL34_10700 [Candidatus Sulfotelmatobacter sp.]|nr:hypothetical protein [Candidatus Sulfotelmatobacter sp.]
MTQDRIIWWLPLIVVAVTVVVLISLITYDAMASILFVFLIAPVFCFVCFLLLLAAIIRRRLRLVLTMLLTLVGFVAISWSVLRNEGVLRPLFRWTLWSHRYKAELMAQREPSPGELKHVQWDAWGIVPTGFTVVYLVFDPSDSLANAARLKKSGRFPGIPCEIQGVRHLERQWYAVTFYTDENWGDCPYSDHRGR